MIWIKKGDDFVKHYGDICKMNGAEVERVECVIGGSPCQDLSVAGKRAGLAGERSGLFMEQIRLIKEMRARDEADGRTCVDVFPRFMVWENVIGAFSSNGGEDFRAVLEETCRIAEPTVSIPRYEGGRWTNAGAIIGDRYSVAWRTHDAQYWGVPQRRRRISLVADFNGSLAPEILFERDSGKESESKIQSVSDGVSRDPSESGSEGQDQDDAGNPDSSVGTASGCFTFRNHYDGRIINDQSLTLDTCGGVIDSPFSISEGEEDSNESDVYGFPLGIRPENVNCYKETSATLCNGTRPGFTTGVVFDIKKAGGGTHDRPAVKHRLECHKHIDGVGLQRRTCHNGGIVMGFRAESGSDSRSIGLAIECAPTFGVSVGHSAAILDAREDQCDRQK